MKYFLKDCRTGKAAEYKTVLKIRNRKNTIVFFFRCENSKLFCPYNSYNAIHSKGDVCEILIGSDPERKDYFEFEISPNNCQMISNICYKGVNELNEPLLDIKPIAKSFLKSKTKKLRNGYIVKAKFNKDNIRQSSNDLIYFNAYRIETDGGEMEKHLFALFPTLCGHFHVPEKFKYLLKNTSNEKV